MSTLNLGVHFPQGQMPADYQIIRKFLIDSEAQGFDHINVPDHVLQTQTPRADFPAAANYTTEYPHHEVLSVLSFAAAVTDYIKLKTAVLILPQRQAALVAKQAAQIDVLSNGRLQLGVGLGWNEPEYEALHMSFTNRAARMEEQIQVCRALWQSPHVTFAGKWHTINDAGVAPMPIQQPIPVWIGAFAPPAIKRAARIADGWQAMLPAPDGQAKSVFDQFKADAAQAGRNPDTIGIEATIFATGDDTSAWLHQAHAWLECGATQIMFRPQGDFHSILRANEAWASVLSQLR